MKYTFETANNGWIMKDDEGNTYVSSEGDDEHEGFLDFIRIITDTIGPMDSRYSEKRIHVMCIPGDKCEEKITGEYREHLEYIKDRITSALKN